MTALDLLLEPLQYDFMVRALVTTVIAAVVCGVLSCWLVLIGWSLMGDAVSHAVLPGVVLAYVVGAPFALGALVFGLLAVALIGTVRSTGRVKEDAAIGIVFTTLFALGLVLISVTPSQTDLNHIIFGNILGVSGADLAQIAALAVLALAVLVLKRRDLTLYAFDPTHAHAIGLSPRRLSALLLGLLALTAVVALQVVGVILVVALLIIPGATASLLTDRFGRMLVIAPALAAAAAVVGIYLSYWWDASSGGMVVLVQGAAFALAHLFGPRHGLLGRRLRAVRQGRAVPSGRSGTVRNRRPSARMSSGSAPRARAGCLLGEMRGADAGRPGAGHALDEHSVEAHGVGGDRRPGKQSDDARDGSSAAFVGGRGVRAGGPVRGGGVAAPRG